MQQYLQLILSGNEPMQEMVIAELAAIGFDSFEENDDNLSAFCLINLYQDEEVQAILDKYHFSIKKRINMPVKNWNEEWEKNFQPITTQSGVYVRSPFHPAAVAGVTEIVIQPKNTFGTGHHETTQLMLDMMHHIPLQGRQIFDYGCGTGVLAIYACIKGARQSVCIDTDPWCTDNIEENKQLNGISNLEFTCCDLNHYKGIATFDVVLANINKNILLDSFHLLSQMLHSQGDLLISGFYQTDIKDLSAKAAETGLMLQEHSTKNNWCAAHLKKL